MGAAASLYAALEAVLGPLRPLRPLGPLSCALVSVSLGPVWDPLGPVWDPFGIALEAPEKVGALVLATPPTAWATRARLK